MTVWKPFLCPGLVASALLGVFPGHPAARAADEGGPPAVLTSRTVGGDAEPEEEARAQTLLLGVGPASITSGRGARKAAGVFGELAVPAVTHDPAQAAWGRMQKSAKAKIDFDDLDTFVRSYQAAGFTELTIILDGTSPWGAGEGRWTPAVDHEEAYAGWVAAVVERYDADGIDDMPELLRPVLRYQVGSRFAAGASADDYVHMLDLAAQSARVTCEEVQLALAGFFVTPAFVSRPTGMAEVEQAFADAGQALPQGLASLRRVLDRSDLFDLVNLEALGSPYEIEDAVDWVREEMATRDYAKPVMLGRVATSPFLAWGAATRGEGVVVPPATEEDRLRLAAYFTRLTEKDEAALAWVRSFAAADLTRKTMVAAERGVLLMHHTPMEDIADYLKRNGEAALGNAAWAGMVGGKQRRPTLFALDQIALFLRNYDEVIRLPAQHDRVRVYEVRDGKERRWVAWADPEQLLLPGARATLMEIDLPATASHLMYERLATGLDGAHPVRTSLPARKGMVPVRLRPYPVFLYSQF
jgi:hypothetical protein